MIFEVHIDMKPPLSKRASYSFKRYSIRTQILKYLHCRHMLIIISSLVVLECMCVMAELLVDLHGIRVRFENEEKQILKFVTFMRSKHPDLYAKMDGHTLGEVLQILKEAQTLWDPKAESKCKCENQDSINRRSSKSNSRVRRSSVKNDSTVRVRHSVRSDMKNKARNFNIRNDNVSPEIKLGKPSREEFIRDLVMDKGLTRQKFREPQNPKRVRANYYTVTAYDSINSGKTETQDSEKLVGVKNSTLKTGVAIDESTTQSSSKVTGWNDFSVNSGNKIDILETHSSIKTLGTKDIALNDGVHNDMNKKLDLNRKIIRRKDPTLDYDQDVHRQFNNNHFVPDDLKSLGLHKAMSKVTLLKDYGTKSARYRRSPIQNCSYVPDIFVFAVNTDIENYYLVTEFKPLQDTNITQYVHADIQAFQKEYEKQQNVATILTYVGFAIFSLMLSEILVKLACLGLGFFKKKIDVFDAFIVVVSFALDAVSLDSKWYETGKGATTILVLLLPWRVVRIVNSFLITLNHKHYIEVMTIRRAKKKCEIKICRLKELVMALRRDIDLLVNLSKAKGATDPEIAACIYGKGRCTATLAAITSFASLMFISTLGKKDPFENDVRDDLYGNIIRDIFDDVDDETDTDKGTSTIMITKDDDDDDIEDESEHDEIYTVTQSLKKVGSRKKTETKFTSQRRATIPRRHVSCSDDDKPTSCSYVNDGYVTCDEIKQEAVDGCITKSLQFKSMPSLQREASPGKNNVLTFEVRTQVSYL